MRTKRSATPLPAVQIPDDTSSSPRACSHRWNLPTWEHLVSEEHLIDLAEWANSSGLPRLTRYRCAFTASLWAWIHQVPFAEIGHTCPAKRVHSVLRSADRALIRAQTLLSMPLAPPGFAICFGTPMKIRSENPPWSILRVHVEFVEKEIFCTIGRCGDFTDHPLRQHLPSLPDDYRVCVLSKRRRRAHGPRECCR